MPPPARSQHLDLSNCCLARVPAVLARLPHLTALTLNENDGLSGEAALAPLAGLTRLHTLEMRECGLASVPRAVTALTNLRSLLLGYNAMTEVRLLGGGEGVGEGHHIGAGEEEERGRYVAAGGSRAHVEAQACCMQPEHAPPEHAPCPPPCVPAPPQRPPIPGGPYLAGLRVLAMSDARGFQDDTPFDVVAEPLGPAAALEVLRLNRCLGLQLGKEGAGAGARASQR